MGLLGLPFSTCRAAPSRRGAAPLSAPGYKSPIDPCFEVFSPKAPPRGGGTALPGVPPGEAVGLDDVYNRGLATFVAPGVAP